MRRSLLHLAAASSAVAILLSIGIAQPKLTVGSDNVDLGIVYNGSVAKAKIKVENTGTETLKISSIRASCGCTTVREPKSDLRPGESDYLEVEFNSSGFRGKVVKHVTIETNDPSNQFSTITLSADIREELEPVKNYSLLWFGDVPVGQKAEQTYALRNVSKNPISLKGIQKQYAKLGISFNKKTVAPSDSVVLTVSVVPEQSGFRNELFFVMTDSKNQPKVPIRVSFVGVAKK